MNVLLELELILKEVDWTEGCSTAAAPGRPASDDDLVE